MFYLNELGLVCALGHTHAKIKQHLNTGKSGVVLTDRYLPGQHLPLGCVSDDFPAAIFSMYEQLPLHEKSRNNLILLAALDQIKPAVDAAIQRYGADRIAIVLGTSTSGVGETETALKYYLKTNQFPAEFHYNKQELSSPATMLASVLHTSGPAYVHSNACASSAKAMASAARLLKMGICDAVLTGGVDSLCGLTIAGFSALKSVSRSRCNPLSANRDGINIGEGAALFLMTRESATVSLRGWGESSDAYHISAPDPSGAGAQLAIEQALMRAGIKTSEIEYINLHGTATLQNDAMEAAVMARLFGDKIPVSSTKPFTGHALGATSAIEAGLCWLTMQDDNKLGLFPPHLWDGNYDSQLPELQVVNLGDSLKRPIRWILSTSFAFGGSNAALILGRE